MVIESELVPLLERGVIIRVPDFDLPRDKTAATGAGAPRVGGGSGASSRWALLPSPLQMLRIMLPVCIDASSRPFAWMQQDLSTACLRCLRFPAARSALAFRRSGVSQHMARPPPGMLTNRIEWKQKRC